MKIGLSISRLSRGGSERQLAQLAKGLTEKGHSVCVYCYGGPSDLDSGLAASMASFHTGKRQGWLARVRDFSAWIDEVRPDVVHGFMKRASTLAVLARRKRHNCAVLASDFSTATYRPNSIELRAALFAFRHADAVVTQTELNRKNLERLAPALKSRLHVVRNGLDVGRFTRSQRSTCLGAVRFGAVGTVCRVKNPLTLVRAAALVRDACKQAFTVDWVGRLGYGGDQNPTNEYVEAEGLIETLNLGQYFRFLGERSDVESQYGQWDALIHPSVQEGFPNVVAEGMACGLPILVGRISDLPQVVDVAENGFVFEQDSPESIAKAMLAFIDTPRLDRLEMGKRSVRLSHDWFSMDRFIREYEALYEQLLVARR